MSIRVNIETLEDYFNNFPSLAKDEIIKRLWGQGKPSGFTWLEETSARNTSNKQRLREIEIFSKVE